MPHEFVIRNPLYLSPPPDFLWPYQFFMLDIFQQAYEHIWIIGSSFLYLSNFVTFFGISILTVDERIHEGEGKKDMFGGMAPGFVASFKPQDAAPADVIKFATVTISFDSAPCSLKSGPTLLLSEKPRPCPRICPIFCQEVECCYIIIDIARGAPSCRVRVLRVSLHSCNCGNCFVVVLCVIRSWSGFKCALLRFFKWFNGFCIHELLIAGGDFN